MCKCRGGRGDGGDEWTLIELSFNSVTTKTSSEKAKTPGMCPSFGGNVGETQLHHFPFIPTSYLLRSVLEEKRFCFVTIFVHKHFL